MDPVVLRGLSNSKIEYLVKRYKWNYEIPQTRDEIMTLAERYYTKIDQKYSIELLYKVFFWYLYDRYRGIDCFRKPSFLVDD